MKNNKQVLLDSVIVIDHLNGVNEASSYLRDLGEQGVISAITRAEVLAGIPENGTRSTVIKLLNHYRCLSIDAPVADEAARLHCAERWKLPDALQAAVATLHDLHLATRNTKDFSPDRYDFVIVPYVLDRTDHQVASACAPSDFATYNCLLSWSDKGSRTGYVLYTYFRVVDPWTSDPKIEFSGTVYARGGSNTVAGPTAVFFADRFWLGWKTATYPAKVAYVVNTSGYTGWTGHTELLAERLAGPPTFYGRINNEGVLVWSFTN